MQEVDVSIRVHANSSLTQDHVLPQALDFALTRHGKIRMTRVSGIKRIVLDESEVLEFWRRWLPWLWSMAGYVRGDADGLDWAFFHEEGQSHSPTLVVGTGVMEATFHPSELEAAIVLVGSSRATEISMSRPMEVHDLSATEGSRVVRHNHRIHQHTLDIEELDL